MITKIQNNFAKTRIQMQNNKPQDLNYMTKTNKACDTVSFSSAFRVKTSQTEKMTKETKRLFGLVADLFQEQRKAAEESFDAAISNFKAAKANGITMEPPKYLPHKSFNGTPVGGCDVAFCQESSFADYSIKLLNKGKTEHEFLIKDGEIGVIKPEDQRACLNEEVQKYLKAFLPEGRKL